MAIVSGAALGAVAIYLLRTPAGHRLLDTTIGILDDFSYECARFQQACVRAHVAATESWQAVRGSTMSGTGGERDTVF